MFFIQKTLDRICNFKYFIKINIITTFNCLRMNFENKKYTIFRIRFDLFEYLIMFFELCNVSIF